MNYELRHFNTPLLRFSVTEDSSEPDAQILWVNEANKNLLPFHFATSLHKDVTERLRQDNPQLYRQVKIILEKNKQERHIRGGMATRRKYKGD